MFSVIIEFLIFLLFLPKYKNIYPKTLNLETFLEGARVCGYKSRPLLLARDGIYS